MQLLDLEILDLTRQLSPAILVVAALVGLFLWMFGAYSHRFWMAMGVTVASGVVGLFAGRDFGVQPLVAALLLALAAGVLSLSLARVALFLAGGLAALVLLRAMQLDWNGFVCFVVGGIGGVCLYQVWVMLLSGLVGALLLSYAILSLLDVMGRLDAVAFATKNGPLLNWGVAGLATLGVVVQFVLDRRRQGRKVVAKAKRRKKAEPPPPPAPPPPPPPPPKWWQFGGWLSEKAA